MRIQCTCFHIFHEKFAFERESHGPQAGVGARRDAKVDIASDREGSLPNRPTVSLGGGTERAMPVTRRSRELPDYWEAAFDADTDDDDLGDSVSETEDSANRSSREVDESERGSDSAESATAGAREKRGAKARERQPKAKRRGARPSPSSNKRPRVRKEEDSTAEEEDEEEEEDEPRTQQQLQQQCQPIIYGAMRRLRCGTCAGCVGGECGTCKNCLNMPKYGGPGTFKQPCVHRRCVNMVARDPNAPRVYHGSGATPDPGVLKARLAAYVGLCGGHAPDVERGWQVSVESRLTGNSAGTYDVYYFDPRGRRFRSRTEVVRFLGLELA